MGIVFQPRLSVHPDASGDIRLLIDMGGAAAIAGYRIAALLEQARKDASIVASLLTHDFGVNRSEPYHISKWQAFWNQGFDIWRIKIWDDPHGSLPYRIVYAYEPPRLVYHVLGVVPRSFKYDLNHPLTVRIVGAYRDLALAEYNRATHQRGSGRK